ncbi:hypothetical protein TSUD_357160 [Trifolium subterraneum]|uniref:Uncharacterized protein n=1 Tax=Trifolium subterraneum TaxID=3900 RepID=A0A2Z6NV35_TRISU|nr:hypothetical protein TSUD_357160 [Trifolium subterraneum]
MKSAAFHNISVRQHRLDADSYNYNSAVVCLPESKVPRQFKYRTSDSKITIGFPYIYHSLGFIFSVVISPSNRMKNEEGSGAKIQCKCSGEDGNRVGLVSEWYSEPITNLNMDHLFVWYDPYHSDSILDNDKTTLSFEFNLITDMSENDGFFSLKECVQQMSKSIGRDNEMEGSDITSIDICDEEENVGISCMQQNQELDMIEKHEQNEGNHTESVERCNEKESTIEIIQRQNQELDCNEQHEGREGIHIESVERRDEEKSISESIQIQNQKSDLNEKCHCLYDCIIVE